MSHIHLGCPSCGARSSRDGFRVRGQFCVCGWRAPVFAAGDRIVSGSGRRGVVVKSERVWVTVRWDNDDEFDYTFHAYDRWIRPAHVQLEATDAT